MCRVKNEPVSWSHVDLTQVPISPRPQTWDHNSYILTADKLKRPLARERDLNQVYTHGAWSLAASELAATATATGVAKAVAKDVLYF